MLMDNDTAPGIEEQYASANDSSNLRVEAERRSDADILIAAGWSASRIGAALMRLQTKADRLALEGVHGQVIIQAQRWGMERPEAIATAVLAWWLSHVCGRCNGVRFELIPGTPALSAKQCQPCRGTGETVLPYGEAGRRLAAWMDDCRERGAQSIKRRLHDMQK